MRTQPSRRHMLALLGLPGFQGVVRERPERKRYVALLTGETGHDSDRSLELLAQELESRHGLRCNLQVASGTDDFPGVDALEDADLAVLYLDSLELPGGQLNEIKRYVNAGKPLVAFRTTTHAFQNWKEFGMEVLGAPWRYHYGAASGTDVRATPEAAGHPIVEGVEKEFRSRSPLYHVLPLAAGCRPLLMGTPVGPSDRPERVPNPVAWTRTYKGGRVFYTSLGHPEDFRAEPVRRLVTNAVHWALGRKP